MVNKTGQLLLYRVIDGITSSSFSMLRCEQERLRTFVDWSNTLISPVDLAANGFYYLGDHDRCMCVFCYIVLTNWVKDETVKEEHQRISPFCPFVNKEATENIPAKCNRVIEKLKQYREKYKLNRLKCEPYETSDYTHLTATEGRLYTHSLPRIPEYASLESRILSFKMFGQHFPLECEPFAEAGFFYKLIPRHDTVQCFHCGYCFSYWEKYSDPWYEHAYENPHCLFVHANKSKEFIDEIEGKKILLQSLSSSTASTSLSLVPPPSSSSLSNLLSPALYRQYDFYNMFNDKDFDLLMELSMPMYLTAFGCNYDMVRMVLVDRLKEIGMPFMSITDYTDFEEKQKKKQEQQQQQAYEQQLEYEQMCEYKRISEEEEQQQQEEEEEEDGEKQQQQEEEDEEEKEQYEVEEEEDEAETKAQEKGRRVREEEEETKAQKKHDNLAEILYLRTQVEHLKKTIRESDRKRECKICLDKESDVVFLPCSHITCCFVCSLQIPTCPICRQPIDKVCNFILC